MLLVQISPSLHYLGIRLLYTLFDQFWCHKNLNRDTLLYCDESKSFDVLCNNFCRIRTNETTRRNLCILIKVENYCEQQIERQTNERTDWPRTAGWKNVITRFSRAIVKSVYFNHIKACVRFGISNRFCRINGFYRDLSSSECCSTVVHYAVIVVLNTHLVDCSMRIYLKLILKR